MNQKQTRTEKIKIALDLCTKEIKEALRKGDEVSLFIAMYKVDGALELCKNIGLDEVQSLLEEDEILEEFYKACNEIISEEE